MELEAKFIQALPVQSGTSKTGKPWKKQDIIVESLGQYPKKICISLFNDKTDTISSLRPGQNTIFHIDIESREFQGRWFTSVSCFRITQPQTSQNTGYTQQPSTYTPPSQYGQPPAQQASGFGGPYTPGYPAYPSPEEEGLPF